VKVVVEKDKSGEKSASLYARNDDKNEHEIKATFKIKYLKPPHPNHNPRFNEVFTSVATTRIIWVLGFPADHVYPPERPVASAAPTIHSGRSWRQTGPLRMRPRLQDRECERDLPWDQINLMTMRPGRGRRCQVQSQSQAYASNVHFC